MKQNFCKEAEIFLLSGMATSEDMLCYGIEVLKVQDFGSVKHQIIFSIFKEIYQKGGHAGVEKIILLAREKNFLEELDGTRGIMETLGAYVSNRDDLQSYLAIVKDYSLFRKIEASYANLGKLISSDKRLSANDISKEFKKMANELEEELRGGIGKDVGAEKEKSLSLLEERAKNKKKPEEILSGIRQLDLLTGSIEGGKLITIGARTGMGKTVLALNIALELVKQGRSIYFFSLEMDYREIEERIYSQVSGVEQKNVHVANLSDQDMENIRNSLGFIDKKMLLVDDKGGIKIEEIVSKAKRAKEMFNISSIFIDYLQLIRSSEKNEFRHLEIANFTQSLKNLSKELNIPVICLAQLSRKADERSDHTPIMSDLKESGAIEQDSDLVLAIYRRDYYIEGDRPGEAEILVLKNRHGQTGKVRVKFDKERCKFKELERG